ncbi:major facilitator superfamily MFS_1 [Syntrophobotulus glycolicus DSM 8271]|uniref:Major facilitator superfamily MFS_1 n=1 Tax=Syntrophobotulus glycolicus (strain DSM 8271 / FlGlyR) TaxID=645991 RepID=F0STR5_SYNGF|nr:MFS transporter [Syntrophobotulus glycolicus]ADY55355.1 major facilitator superfamily MFS_1 [Syntrophobotulus glycolicus DSM 8271]
MDHLCGKVLINRFPALRHKNFRIFLIGQSISLIGTWMQRAAQQWVIYELTKSAFIVGLVGVFQFTPLLLFSLFAGVFADRFPKKRVLLLTQTIQMLQAFTLAVLFWTGRIQYWHILILAGVLGLAHTFDMPTRQSFFIELVGKEALGCAIGMNSSIVNIARIIGPALGGLLLMYFGGTFCFFFNAFSFIAVLISLMKIQSYHVNIRKKGKNVFHEIKDGLKYIYAKEILFQAILSMLIVGTIAMNSDVIIPVFAKEVLKQQAGGYSLLLSSMGVGSLIGSLIFAGRSKITFEKQNLMKTSLLLSVFLVFTGLLQNYYLVIFSLAGVGLFSMIFMATVNSTIQLNSSDEYRGRAMGVYSMVFTGTTPIGNLFSGIVTQKFGANASFITCGGLCTLLVLLLYLVKKQ